MDNLASLPGSQPPPSICPDAWTCTDIGDPTPAGQDQLTSSGTWHKAGGGGVQRGSSPAAMPAAGCNFWNLMDAGVAPGHCDLGPAYPQTWSVVQKG